MKKTAIFITMLGGEFFFHKKLKLGVLGSQGTVPPNLVSIGRVIDENEHAIRWKSKWMDGMETIGP